MSAKTLALASAALLALAAAASAQPGDRRQGQSEPPHAAGAPHGGPSPHGPPSSATPGGGRHIAGAERPYGPAQPRGDTPRPQPPRAEIQPQQPQARPQSRPQPAPDALPRIFTPHADRDLGRRYAPPQETHRPPPTPDGRFAGPHWRPDRYPHSFNSQRRFYAPPYHPPRGYDFRVWRFGDVLPLVWWASEYRIWDWWDYDLPAPPPGYVWIRSGLDALLIDPEGRVVQVVSTIFW